MSRKGTLYITATPLGNLDDITLRAMNILRQSDAIACEDTRRALKLLGHFGITGKKLVSYHSANEQRAVEHIVRLLHEGNNVALITDAGTPAVSDPGYTLVRTAREEEIDVIPVPGPSALTAALSVCPLPCTTFYFAGFLPHKKGRQSRLDYLSRLGSTIVLYESPYRILRLLAEIESFMPDADIFIARELTKLHEQHYCGKASELALQLEEKKIRGEFVVIVSPQNQREKTSNKQKHADHQ